MAKKEYTEKEAILFAKKEFIKLIHEKVKDKNDKEFKKCMMHKRKMGYSEHNNLKKDVFYTSEHYVNKKIFKRYGWHYAFAVVINDSVFKYIDGYKLIFEVFLSYFFEIDEIEVDGTWELKYYLLDKEKWGKND